MKEKNGYPIGNQILLTNVEARRKLTHQIQEDTLIPNRMRKTLLFILPSCQSVTICEARITDDAIVRDLKSISHYGEGARHIRFTIAPYKDADDCCHTSSYGDIFCRKADYETLCCHYQCNNLKGQTLTAFRAEDAYTNVFLAIY